MIVKVVTFGCRLNTAESEAMERAARLAGHSGLTIVNTCAVTAEAVRQAKQTIRRLARDEPGQKIVVTGCAAQVQPETFADMAEVSHVLGNSEKNSVDIWQVLREEDSARLHVSDIMSVRENAPHLESGFGSRTRAFVQVQTGCDHRCTFCIIPYGRGNARSVPMGAVIDHVQRLIDAGVPEVVLTGVDLTSYGKDLPSTPSLGTLVQALLKHVTALKRLRISSIDSIEVDDALLEAITGTDVVLPHLHLSLQAGDDLILKRMKRRHNRAEAIAFCDSVRAKRSEIVFGADFIAGFPTETEAMFEQTVQLVEECGLTHLHVFPFSPRVGTPAAKMPQVPKPMIKERAQRLREVGANALNTALHKQVGLNTRVLVERNGFGHTDTFLPVCLNDLVVQAGSLVRVTPTHVIEGMLGVLA
jgi:threonylcarbamoyladenosine tRNA methylthiotransferase MtaB